MRRTAKLAQVFKENFEGTSEGAYEGWKTRRMGGGLEIPESAKQFPGGSMVDKVAGKSELNKVESHLALKGYEKVKEQKGLGTTFTDYKHPNGDEVQVKAQHTSEGDDPEKTEHTVFYTPKSEKGSKEPVTIPPMAPETRKKERELYINEAKKTGSTRAEAMGDYARGQSAIADSSGTSQEHKEHHQIAAEAHQDAAEEHKKEGDQDAADWHSQKSDKHSKWAEHYLGKTKMSSTTSPLEGKPLKKKAQLAQAFQGCLAKSAKDAQKNIKASLKGNAEIAEKHEKEVRKEVPAATADETKIVEKMAASDERIEPTVGITRKKVKLAQACSQAMK